MELNTQLKPRYIVTSFRAHSENWKKLKVLATIDGMAIQDKLNEVIVDYLDNNYNNALGIVTRSNGESKEG
tara:strand:- start:2806 stop:3018 length:213 start_codon:yes stop_codon:yes gene_type:complete